MPAVRRLAGKAPALVPAGEAVKAVQPIARVEVVDRALAVDGERLRVARDVDRPPPDGLFRIRVLHDPLVLGGAAGLHAGIGHQGAVFGNACVFLVTNGVLVKRAWREVAVNVANRQMVRLETEIARRRVLHSIVTDRKAGTGTGTAGSLQEHERTSAWRERVAKRTSVPSDDPPAEWTAARVGLRLST